MLVMGGAIFLLKLVSPIKLKNVCLVRNIMTTNASATYGGFGMRVSQSDVQRFFDKTTVILDGCWEWTAWITDKGYGQFQYGGRMMGAHRFSYQLVKGEILHTIDHLCRNRRCVNPNHLEDVTQKENVRRGGAMGYQRKQNTLS